MKRCLWCKDDPLYTAYHDTEWGCPLHDDRALFEYLILEGMQAGLSWLIILRRREAFREAFAAFDPQIVARFSEQDVERLLQNPKIIRNRAKIKAAIRSANEFLKIQKEFGSFDSYIWRFVQGIPIQNGWTSQAEVPCSSPLSDRMSKELKERGFSFVGSKICYSFMQAVGMVNDHIGSCFRQNEVERLTGE